MPCLCVVILYATSNLSHARAYAQLQNHMHVAHRRYVNQVLAARTRQGMMAVKPGRFGEVPEAENVSWPALKEAVVRVKVQSGDRDPRKWRAT